MKNKIDLRLVSYRVFNDLIGNLYPRGSVIPGYNISNPFLSHQQKTPSFNVFKAKDGTLIYKDFATGDKGNCISFIQKLRGITIKEAIKYIKNVI
jgi:hypothetical protein